MKFYKAKYVTHRGFGLYYWEAGIFELTIWKWIFTVDFGGSRKS